MKTLRWRDLGVGRAAFHLARNGDGTWREVPLHGHDFPELFFVVCGAGVHRANGRRTSLAEGDLVLIRPGDRHSLQAEKDSPFSIINLAFENDTLVFLGTRYFPDQPGFPGVKRAGPQVFRLSERSREWLRGELELLERQPATRLVLERLLLNLLVEVMPGMAPAPASEGSLPVWLEQACGKSRRGDPLVKGPREFARLAGRSLEHVSRVMRARTGRTPTEFVNEVRLDHAAAMLLSGAKEIVDVAGDCGFQSISHFYSCFRNRFGMSPRKYRLKHRRVFGQM